MALLSSQHSSNFHCSRRKERGGKKKKRKKGKREREREKKFVLQEVFYCVDTQRLHSIKPPAGSRPDKAPPRPRRAFLTFQRQFLEAREFFPGLPSHHSRTGIFPESGPEKESLWLPLWREGASPNPEDVPSVLWTLGIGESAIPHEPGDKQSWRGCWNPSSRVSWMRFLIFSAVLRVFRALTTPKNISIHPTEASVPAFFGGQNTMRG